MQPRRAHRVDGNQSQIVDGLRKCGYSVAITSPLGDGFTDLVVGGYGMNLLMECKLRGQQLTKEQSRFHSFWRGPIVVVHTIDEALEFARTRGRDYR